jgi:ATP-dependent DNA helicase RecG
MGVRVKVVPALEANDAKYAYEATEDFVKVSVGKASGNSSLSGQKSGISENQTAQKRRESVGKASGIILEACRERTYITIPELAVIAGITERSVERNIRKLQEGNLLRRVGGRKEGRWEVLV